MSLRTTSAKKDGLVNIGGGQSHFDWVIESFAEIVERIRELPGYRIVRQAPFLRAFTAQLEPLRPSG